MPLKTICAFIFTLLILDLKSQGLTCAESEPFCTGTLYDFPAGTEGNAESGPFYGCLASQPAPAWYHLKIGNPGPITIYMHSEPQEDIDFACWGPFTDPASACPAGLTQSKMIDCCYCGSWEETCDIPNGQTGEYYILLITNFSRHQCNIIFSQTGGSGSTDCSILPPMVSSDSPLCVGDTLHLTAETIANATYSWTGPAGFSSSIQNPVIPNVTLSQSGNYECIITIYSQTSPPAITSVDINDLPDASLVNSSMTVCPGDPAYIIMQLTGEGPFEVIYYDGASYITIPGLNGPVDTITVNPPGPASYNLMQVSDTNCTKDLSGLTFQVLNYPPASGALSGGGIICPGDTALLTFNLTGTPPWTITYNSNGINPQTIEASYSPFELQVFPLVTTTYQFTSLVDAHCTGPASGSAVVTVDYPSGMLSGDNTICAGGGAQLIFTLTGYPPWTITYSANGGNDQTVTTTYSPFSVAVSPAESTLYEFTALEDGYCTGTTEGQAMLNIFQPSGVLDGSETICSGESAGITFELEGNPPWTISYTANGTDEETFTAYTTPYVLQVNPIVTTNYQFTYFEDNFCVGIPTGEAVITVNPLPDAGAGEDKTIPNGTATTLNGEVSSGSGNYSFQWQPSDKLVDAQVLQPFTVNLFSSTLFTLSITDNNGGCVDEDEILVTITGGVLSSSAFAGPSEICKGEPCQLQAIASGGSGNYTYFWSSNPPGFSSDLQNPVINPLISTIYTVTINDGYNVTQANVSVTVNQLPVPDAGPDQLIPFGTGTVLHGSASSGSGNYHYHWEPADKLDNPDIPDPVTVNITETTLFTLSVTDSETYCPCDGSDAVAVMISGSALTANPSASPGTICSGESVQLYALPGGGSGLYNYSWESDPPGFISTQPDPVVNPCECTVYNLTVDDGFNSVSGSVGVTVNAKPVVVLGTDTTLCVYDSLLLDAGNEGSSYIWSNGSTDRAISIGTTGIGYDSRVISVSVTSPEGCTSSASRLISFDFAACSAIDDPDSGHDIIIYPNPGNGLINLESKIEEGKYNLIVINNQGKIILENREMIFTGRDNKYILDLRKFSRGLYLLKLVNPEQISKTYKIIVE